MKKSKTKATLVLEQVLGENAPSMMTGIAPRDSDTEMIIQMLQKYYNTNFTAEQLNKIRQLNFESVTRARRKYQKDGQYLPSPEVAQKRRLKSYEIQQVSPSESPSGLQARIESNA